jgi:hypothetical protein
MLKVLPPSELQRLFRERDGDDPPALSRSKQVQS